MLRFQINSRGFQTSSSQLSKASKRRKVPNIINFYYKYTFQQFFQDTKLKQSPNLQKHAVNQGKIPVTKKALNFFDNHYKQIYGEDWHTMRLALLSKRKIAALVNNFSEKEVISEEMKSIGCLSVQEIYNQGKLIFLLKQI